MLQTILKMIAKIIKKQTPPTNLFMSSLTTILLSAFHNHKTYPAIPIAATFKINIPALPIL